MNLDSAQNLTSDEINLKGMGPQDKVVMPALQIPSFRVNWALERGVERKLMMRTWGGLGDQICAEPTLRWATTQFKDAAVYLASEHPELFSHLDFVESFDLKRVMPRYEQYFLFDTIVPPNHLTWEFFSHCLTNCVDFASMCAFRSQLPVKMREIIMRPPTPRKEVQDLLRPDYVLVHAGRHWPSKTFPKDWWDSVLKGLQARNLTPVLIGADTDDARGTVDVDPTWCIDVRNQHSIMETLWLCQRARVLLTNDSSPLHMAASHDPMDPTTGRTWIGFIATCKHPDYISHFRMGEWAWREKNLGRGGIWEDLDHLPNKREEVTVDQVSEEKLRSWLPDPDYVADWTRQVMESLEEKY